MLRVTNTGCPGVLLPRPTGFRHALGYRRRDRWNVRQEPSTLLACDTKTGHGLRVHSRVEGRGRPRARPAGYLCGAGSAGRQFLKHRGHPHEQKSFATRHRSFLTEFRNRADGYSRARIGRRRSVREADCSRATHTCRIRGGLHRPRGVGRYDASVSTSKLL